MAYNMTTFNAARRTRTEARIAAVKQYISDYGAFDRREITAHFSKEWGVSTKTVGLVLQTMTRRGIIKRFEGFSL